MASHALKILIATTAAAAALACASVASAQTNTGTTIGQFLLIEPSARIAGMGNAGVSMYEGLGSAYYNPALAARETGYQLAFTHSAWFADITYDYAAASMAIGSLGQLYGTLTALNSGDIAVRTVNQPLGTGELYSVSDIALGLGYAKQISYRFAAGAQVNYMQENIWHSSVSTITFNIGTLYRLSDHGLRIGSSLSNFGTHGAFNGADLRFTYDNTPSVYGDNSQLPGSRYTDPFPVPVLFRVGLGMPYELSHDTKLLVAADLFHPNDNTESMSIGAEATLKDRLALRAGWQNLFLQDSEVGLTLGAGLSGKLDVYHYHCDYAWADEGRLGHVHRLSLGLTFQ
jgi:hypothetical protein